LVIVVYLAYWKLPSINALLFPFFVLPIFLLTIGLGFIIAIFQVIIADTKSFINVGLNFFLFLMPIMYTLPEKGLLSRINRYNPVYFLIKSARDIVIQGKIDYPLQFIVSVFLSIIVFVLGWFIFYISQDKLTERI
jgi:ABC-type polysaccharide/polyol phosphate export permease